MRTIFLIFPGFQLLDLSGPAAVFGAAAQALGKPPDMVTVSAAGGAVLSSCGVEVQSVPARGMRAGPRDTLLVVGGEREGLETAMADAETGSWFAQGAARARRYGSICSGTFALAAWGLLDGRRAATHWRGARALQNRFPGVEVDAEALFVEDGRLWTSAGVTTGIDMALAMVERDVGLDIANTIARRLVLTVRRPGHQSQYSSLLGAQAGGGGNYADLVAYIAANLSTPLGVEALAERAGDSLRSFHRRFRKAVGQSPAAFVMEARLSSARDLLADGMPVKLAAARAGFSSPAQLGRAFQKKFGIAPGAYRAMHANPSALLRP